MATFVEEDFKGRGAYSVSILNALGVKIFANPEQVTQALNANPTLGGGFLIEGGVPGKEILWTTLTVEMSIIRDHNSATPTHTYGLIFFDEDEAMIASPGETTQEFRTKMNTLKTVLESLLPTKAKGPVVPIAPVPVREIVSTRTSKRYPLYEILGRGSYGEVYRTSEDRILKLVTAINEKEFVQELEIQRELTAREPGVCPILYDYGKVSASTKFMIVMERYDDTARKLLRSDHSHAIDVLKQIATIMQRLEKYQFNHRDIHTANIMYKGTPKQYALIDFGYSCATFDGKKYAGTSYFKPTDTCFRRSRDLAQLVYGIEKYDMKTVSATDEIRVFLRLLLTFDINGKKCEMFNGCPPHRINDWADSYKFLNRADIENPHTTPEGLLHAISVYEQHGIEACKNGFVVDPVSNACVPKPSKVVKVPRGMPETPSPRNNLGLKPCPPGKVRNPVTRRCRKEERGKTKRAATPAPAPANPCPPGKIINPATRRCVNRDGAIGKKLLNGR